MFCFTTNDYHDAVTRATAEVHCAVSDKVRTPPYVNSAFKAIGIGEPISAELKS